MDWVMAQVDVRHDRAESKYDASSDQVSYV